MKSVTGKGVGPIKTPVGGPSTTQAAKTEKVDKKLTADVDLDAKAKAKAGLGGDAKGGVDVLTANQSAIPSATPHYKAPSPKSAKYAKMVVDSSLQAALQSAELKAKKKKSVPPTRNQVLVKFAADNIRTHHAIAEGYDENLIGKSPAEVQERQTFSRAFLAEIASQLWETVPLAESLRVMPKEMGALLQVSSSEGETALAARIDLALAAQTLHGILGMVGQATEHGFKASATEKKLLLQADAQADIEPHDAFASIQSIAERAHEHLNKIGPEAREMSKKDLAELRAEIKAAKKAPDPKKLMAAAKTHKAQLEKAVKDAPEPSIKERFRGAMIGLAIGDALGGPTEFMDKGEIYEKYGMVTDMVGGGWLDLEPGEYTDDTQMAVAMAESIVAKGGLDANDVADRFVTWLNTDPKDVGNLTRQALELRRGGLDGMDAGKIPWQLSGFENAGNGSVMRAAPVALLTAFEGKKVMAQAAKDSSAITHADDRCTWGTAAISLAMQMIMKGEDDVTAKVAEWLESRSPALAEALAEIPDLKLKDLRTSGYVVHTLQAAFWALENATSYPDGVIKVSNLGEDTDTAGATAGILLGAKFGLEGIPNEWRDKLQNSKKLTGLADKLHKMAGEG